MKSVIDGPTSVTKFNMNVVKGTRTSDKAIDAAMRSTALKNFVCGESSAAFFLL
ncbi:MAG: hypothetical protein H5T41_06950 [Methanomassiliicoccales archaeon]|nr:hypothetical protein [Methanomassiliicoccales archaeon]